MPCRCLGVRGRHRPQEGRRAGPDARGHSAPPQRLPGHPRIRAALLRQGRDPADPVVLVGHSQGGRAVLRYAIDHPVQVEHVAVGTPWRGARRAGLTTDVAHARTGRDLPALRDMRPGSPFLTALWRDIGTVADRVTNIYSDERRCRPVGRASDRSAWAWGRLRPSVGDPARFWSSGRSAPVHSVVPGRPSGGSLRRGESLWPVPPGGSCLKRRTARRERPRRADRLTPSGEAHHA